MGEGKTSVILPLLVASIADGKALARATVLKSLFHTNSEVLRSVLGGLLGRRLYKFPCRREMAIQGPEAAAMLKVYEECLQKRGFVVTLPEHRLSFQLKGLEKCRGGFFTDGHELLKVQEWLYANARDVLDESDELLSVKYQLIYTVGDHGEIDGGPGRWLTLQGLLKLVPGNIQKLMDKYPSEKVAECREEDDDAGHTEIFPHCRLFKAEGYYQELCKLLVHDILSGKSWIYFPEFPDPTTRELVTAFLVNPTLEEAQHEKVLAMFSKEGEDPRYLFKFRYFNACAQYLNCCLSVVFPGFKICTLLSCFSF
jgi:hypothetical protein